MRQIGRYKLVSVLGAGGMGQVFKAVDNHSGELVAIKVIHRLQAAEARARMRFVREARAVSQLRHPHIVRVHELGQSNGALYIAMEYLQGSPLSKFIPGPPTLSLRRRMAILAECLEALAYAHSSGIVHRDIKPSNIVVLRDNSAKVVDFGLAEFVRQPDATLRGGTPPYMSPEQFADGVVDWRSDIWSMGITLFELLTGRRPFRDPRDLELGAVPELPSAIPFSVDLNAILKRALALQPEMRYQTAARFAEDLRTVQRRCEWAAKAGREDSLSGDSGANTTSDHPPSAIGATISDDAAVSPLTSSGPITSPGRSPGPTAAAAVSREILSELGFRLPAEGPVTTSQGRLTWKARERWLRDSRRSSLFGPSAMGLVTLATLVSSFLYVGFVLRSHPVYGKDKSTIPILVVIPTGFLLYWLLLLVAERICRACAVIARRARCRNCRLRMILTARWMRVCNSREEVRFGQADCLAALEHRLWPDAAKLLSLYGLERELDTPDSRFLSGALRFDVSFFECRACGNHAARLTTDELVEHLWEERAAYQDAYWGGPSTTTLRGRLAAAREVYRGLLVESLKALAGVDLRPRLSMLRPALLAVSVVGALFVFRHAAFRTPVPPRAGEVRVNVADGQAYVWIPPGTFWRGCSAGDTECAGDEFKARPYRITRGFWIGQTPVTQEAYRRVLHMSPSQQVMAPDHPVEMVTWGEALLYCRKAGGRLPNEAEWEYAARASSDAARYGELDAIAWFAGNSSMQSQSVAKKTPNAFGLFDMLGNVWQWVADVERLDAGPVNQWAQSIMVARGGSFADPPRRVRASARLWNAPSTVSYNVGFRCAANWP